MPEGAQSPPSEGVSRDSVRRWLTARLRADGCGDVDIGELSAPSAGFSGQTVLFHASWRAPDGSAHGHDLVLRLQPPDRQVYFSADPIRQARTMQALSGRPGTPVPKVWFVEPDAAIFGAPCYAMERVPGRIPVDVPSWHARGWTVELPVEQRSQLYDNALSALVAVHRVDWRGDLAFLAEPGSGTALARYLAMFERWYDACEPARRYGGTVLDEAVRRVLDKAPSDVAEGVVWGDARMGNIIFADDLSVAALLDWEAATIGPPGMDLGWWLMFENLLCEAQGRQRLDGIAGRDATITRYVELGGDPTPDIDYYELLADVGILLITSVVADNAVRAGAVTADVAATHPNRIVRMMRDSLDRLR